MNQVINNEKKDFVKFLIDRKKKGIVGEIDVNFFIYINPKPNPNPNPNSVIFYPLIKNSE